MPDFVGSKDDASIQIGSCIIVILMIIILWKESQVSSAKSVIVEIVDSCHEAIKFRGGGRLGHIPVFGIPRPFMTRIASQLY
jgi:hypothetical protein